MIISGCMMTWGPEWHHAFDLVVFIRLEDEVRMARLRQREVDRYGEELTDNENIKENSRLFLEWASQYENPHFTGNTLKFHSAWLKSCPAHILRLDGRDPLAHNAQRVIAEIERFRRVD